MNGMYIWIFCAFVSSNNFACREDDEEDEVDEENTITSFFTQQPTKKQKLWQGKSSSFFSERNMSQLKSVDSIFNQL